MALKQLREHKGYTLAYVANAIGMSEELLEKYENGETKPVGSRPGNLATFYNIELSQMLQILDQTLQSKKPDLE